MHRTNLLWHIDVNELTIFDICACAGMDGVKGDIGLPGPQGYDGLRGTKGDRGLPGFQGEKGDKGELGRSGLRGCQAYPVGSGKVTN